MKLNNFFMSFIFCSTWLFFASCSLSTLSFSMISTETTERDASSSIVYLQVGVEPSQDGTTISWKDYKTEANDGGKYQYQASYDILRSEINPWEGFEKVGTKNDNPYKDKSSRLSFVDKKTTTESPPVWYRIYFSFIEGSGENSFTKVILSESVCNKK